MATRSSASSTGLARRATAGLTSPTTPRNNWLGPYSAIVDWLADQQSVLPGVEALWLHGSRAVGSHIDASNLDLTFIIDKRKSKVGLVETLARTIDYRPRFVDYFGLTLEPFWSTSDGEVDINILDRTALNDRISSVQRSAYDLEKHQAFIEHTIFKADALLDPKRILARARASCASIPVEFFEVLAAKYLRLLEQKTIWWQVRNRWKSDFERFSDLAIIVEEIARCHYALNCRLFMPGMKEYHNDLRTLKPDISVKALQLIELSPQVSQSETRKIVVEIVSTLKAVFTQRYGVNQG